MSSFNDIWLQRLRYALTPQFDMYQSLRERLSGQVLEVGFGTGSGAAIYASEVEHVDAIDIDESAVAFANEMYPLENVAWIHADITSKAWWSARKRKGWQLEGGYDFTVMVEALEHVEEWESALENIKILLKDGGYLIMTARNANADLRRKKQHSREWRSEELIEELEVFFPSVYIYDWALQERQPKYTAVTPLIAMAKK